jgi:hypothetical protein
MKIVSGRYVIASTPSMRVYGAPLLVEVTQTTDRKPPGCDGQAAA